MKKIAGILLVSVMFVNSVALVNADDVGQVQAQAGGASFVSIDGNTVSIGNDSIERMFSTEGGSVRTTAIKNKRTESETVFSPGAGSEDFVIDTVQPDGAYVVSPNLEAAITAPTEKLAKTGWTGIIQTLSGNSGSLARMVDDDLTTDVSYETQSNTYEAIFDLNGSKTFRSFSYLKRQGNTDARWGVNGTVIDYEFYVSSDGASWTKAAQGAFPNAMKKVGNLFNVGNQQYVDLGKTYTATHVKLVALSVIRAVDAGVTAPQTFSGADFSLYADAPVPVEVNPVKALDRTNWGATASNAAGTSTINVPKMLQPKTDASTNGDTSELSSAPPGYFQFDLKQDMPIKSFSYLKRPGYTDARYGINGTIQDFNFYVSSDGETWEKAATGTFPNEMHTYTNGGTTLYNVGVPQYVNLDKRTVARYVRLEGVTAIGNVTLSGGEFNLYDEAVLQPLDRTGWTAKAAVQDVSLPLEIHDVPELLDGDAATAAKIATNGERLEFEFDFGREGARTFNAFSFHGQVVDSNILYLFHTLNADGETWTPVMQGRFEESGDPQYIDLQQEYTTSKVKLTLMATNGAIFFTGAEFNLLTSIKSTVITEEGAAPWTDKTIESSGLTLAAANGIQEKTINGGKQLVFNYEPYEFNGVLWDIAYNVILMDGDSYIRSFLELSVPDDAAESVRINYIESDAFKLSGLPADAVKWERPESIQSTHGMPAYYYKLGKPIYLNSLFLGSEFPLADTQLLGANNDAVQIRYYSGKDFTELDLTAEGKFATWPTIVGAARSNDYEVMQADFQDYIFSIAREVTFRTQFNSWYDGGHNITPDSLYNSFMAVEKGLTGSGLAPIDSYVCDDGWNRYFKEMTFWDLKPEFQGENGLLSVTETVSKLSSAFGLWLGPKGGYDGNNPIISQAIENAGNGAVNEATRGTGEQDIDINHPVYLRKIVELMVQYQKDFNIKYWKLDGFANLACTNPDHGHIVGGDQGMYYMVETWENWLGISDALRENGAEYLNFTTHTVPSPWMFQWANSIFLIGSADFSRTGSGSDADRMLNYRDGQYYNFFNVNQYQIPMVNIYNHDPVFADGATSNPPRMTADEFRTFLFVNAMRGTSLWELYYTASRLTPDHWMINAEALRFAEENIDVLAKSKLIAPYGNPTTNPYAFSAWGEDEGYLMVRNSAGTSKEFKITLDRLNNVPENMRDYTMSYVYPNQLNDTIDSKKYTYGEELIFNLAPSEVRIMKFAGTKDTVKPSIVKTEAMDGTTVRVTFDEPVYQGYASAANTTVGGQQAKSVSVMTDYRTLEIALNAPLTHGQATEIKTVVQDLAGNLSDAQTAGVTYFKEHIVNAFEIAADLSADASVNEDIAIERNIVRLQNNTTSFSDSASVVSSGKMTASMLLKTTDSGATVLKQDGAFEIAVSDEGKAVLALGDLAVQSQQTVNDGQWHLITFVKEANEMLKVYIDGNLNASAYQDASARPVSAGAITIGSDAFTGELSQILLLNDAFDFEEVKEIAEQYPSAEYTVKNTEAFTVAGLTPSLPKNVTIQYESGREREFPVVWDVLEPSQYAEAGRVKITGTVPLLGNAQTEGDLIVFDPYPGDGLKSALNSEWTILNENTENWEITEDGLKIHATSGYLDETANNNQNVFLQDPEQSDYVITVKMSGIPDQNYSSAGPVVYQDNDNFVKVARKYADPNATGSARILSYTYEINGSDRGVEMADPVEGEDLYLALAKTGNLYTAYYSVDGLDWVLIKSDSEDAAKTADFTNEKVGLYATTVRSEVTDFDVVFSEFNFKQYDPAINIETVSADIELPVNSAVPGALWGDAVYSDGSEGSLILTDLAITPEQLQTPGQYAVSGKIAGENQSVTVNVTVYAVENRFDAYVNDNGMITAVFENASGSAVNGLFIVAVYKDGVLVRTELQPFNAAASDAEQKVFALNPADYTGEQYRIKVFAWDGGFIPLDDAVDVQ